ncbi:hypothetical protein [Photobacterium nomapromontoriensis]|uniref:hypothetical protein n=1 Tax=Photobacterium nomapromontoriensis TaxID=2910237 RepID=UPI003D0EC2F5
MFIGDAGIPVTLDGLSEDRASDNASLNTSLGEPSDSQFSNLLRSEPIDKSLSNIPLGEIPDQQPDPLPFSRAQAISQERKYAKDNLNWMKIVASFQDPWDTAIPFLNAEVRTQSDAGSITVHAVGESTSHTNETVLNNTDSYDLQTAKETELYEPGTYVIEDIPQEQVNVLIEIYGKEGINAEIEAQVIDVIADLHDTYEDILRHMKPFNKRWNDVGNWSLADGVADGAELWIKDNLELFSLQFWQDFGGTLETWVEVGWDSAANYATYAYEDTERRYREVLEKGVKNVASFSNGEISFFDAMYNHGN